MKTPMGQQYQPEVACELEPLICTSKKEELESIYKGAIVSLIFLVNDKVERIAYGSGFLISSNLILTAAHNIYARQSMYGIEPFENRKQTFKIYVKACGQVTQKHFQVDKWRYLREYRQCTSNMARYDYALIKIKGHVKQTTFPKLSIFCKQFIHGKIKQPKIKVSGYPQYGENYQLEGKTIKLNQYGRQKENGILEIEDHQMKYTINTYRGHSGSPIGIGEDVVGIHVGGDGVNHKYNLARLINIELLTNLKMWSEQMNGKSFEIDYRHLNEHFAEFIPNLKKQKEEFQTYIAKKDYEIQLLNGEIMKLNLKLAEFEKKPQNNPISKNSSFSIAKKQQTNLVSKKLLQQDQTMQIKEIIEEKYFSDIWERILSIKPDKRSLITCLCLKATVLL